MEEHQTLPAPTGAQSLAKLPEISVLFTQSFKLLKAKIRTFAEILIVSAGGLTLVTGACLIVIIGAAMSFLGSANINWEGLMQGGMAFPQGPSTLTLVSAVISGVVIGASLLALVLLSIYIWAWISTAVTAATAGHDADKSGFDHFKSTQTKVLPVIWTGILRGLVTIGGFVVFVVPGIIFSIWTTFAAMATVLDGKHGFTALNYSKELTRGRFGAVFGRLILLALVYGAIQVVGQLLMMTSVLAFLGYILNQFLLPIASIFFTVAYMVTLYRQLQVVNEHNHLPVKNATVMFKVFSWIGLLAAIGGVFLIVFLISLAALTEKNKVEDSGVTESGYMQEQRRPDMEQSMPKSFEEFFEERFNQTPPDPEPGQYQ